MFDVWVALCTPTILYPRQKERSQCHAYDTDGKRMICRIITVVTVYIYGALTTRLHAIKNCIRLHV